MNYIEGITYLIGIYILLSTILPATFQGLSNLETKLQLRTVRYGGALFVIGTFITRPVSTVELFIVLFVSLVVFMAKLKNESIDTN